jgi:hypothetical protein
MNKKKIVIIIDLIGVLCICVMACSIIMVFCNEFFNLKNYLV